MGVRTVSARSAKETAEPATLHRLRRRALSGGTYLYTGEPLVTDWHAHDMHQLEYAETGVIEMETAGARYLLPPQQAAWIPAGLEHRKTIKEGVRTLAVLFDRGLVPEPGKRVRILAVPPLIRELIVYAERWPIGRLETDEVADGYFRTLSHLVSEALDEETPLSLPTTADPVVDAALTYTQDHLDSVTAGEVARAVGVSERTLRRQFTTVLGLSWRTYLRQARLLRAMALLAEPGRTVLDVSVAVGFENVSAFARAFTEHCGESPATYRRRTRSSLRA